MSVDLRTHFLELFSENRAHEQGRDDEIEKKPVWRLAIARLYFD